MTTKQIIEQAKRLPARERIRVVRALERSLAKQAKLAAPRKRAAKTKRYKRSLELAGTAHADVTDLSTDKYKHVADAAMEGHPER
ncbi:MAG: hypothetical protein IT381_20540 [Deltaproteobacteria bacterium]|nr:hypothetical protein [Deltaproteobacteria bacterium]